LINAITYQDVRQFVENTAFSGYQQIELPFGMTIPGRDCGKVADIVFPERLDGKSVLDVGCYYGYFVHEALNRGASRAVGVEADAERFAIANEIARLKSNGAGIVYSRAESISLDEQFDIVLLLNVLHHVLDPIAVMLNLASLCRETMVVEFCEITDAGYLQSALPSSSGQSLASRLINRLKRLRHTLLMQWAMGNLPLMAVGAREYHRTFYFSRAAFVNLFTVHHKLYSKVEFKPSLRKYRAFAICQRIQS
jgi:2-polyprenyl-3-methyl-5-hydroxy-6-metoxy-1,4-benzoquinol methylase